MMRRLFKRLFDTAHMENTRNIVRLIRAYAGSVDAFCDFGAGDGAVSATISKTIGAGRRYAIENHDPNVSALERQGFTVFRCDLNDPLPLDSSQFQVIVSNQVIEHLYDTDQFLTEAVRLLKPGGLLVVSTENLASWHNVASLVLGWQPFSLTNVSARKGGLGNPLAFFSGCYGACFPMQHHRLFTTKGLLELFQAHELQNITIAAAGYYPLPSVVARLDPWHGHFITIAGRKAA